MENTQTESKVKFLFGHTSFETARRVENYPYGRLRTSIFYWIETVAKKGDRFCSCTINPKNGRLNNPKKSTFCNIGIMLEKPENGHISWIGVGIYTDREKLNAFIERVGESNLNKDQMIQLRQLRGEKVVLDRDPITGDAKKDFKIQWGEKNKAGEYTEVTIRFDRPDGVSAREIFEAMKTLNQDRLNQCFQERDYGNMGKHKGFARIYCRGGVYLGTVGEGPYKEYLASDENVTVEK